MAPAKVNLSLWIVGKERSGYHRILTLFYKIPLYDEILIDHWKESLVRCEGLKSTSDNTVYKALKYLSEYTGRNLCLKVVIKKRIPVGAGLGGGSSDAAAVLHAANLMFDLNLSLEELVEVGAKVGADVPFFLLGERAAIGRGRGYDLQPVDVKVPGNWILVFPTTPVSTRWAYETFSKHCRFTPEEEAEERLQNLIEALRRGGDFQMENDFERVILPRIGPVREAKEALRGAGFKALLSGSGSTVFGVGGKGIPTFPPRFKVWVWRE